MTPEQLKAFIHSEIISILGDYSNIPLEVQNALEIRLGGISLNNSSKTAATETQAVNEAGSGVYSVSKPMDGFVETILPGTGTTIYLPYYL